MASEPWGALLGTPTAAEREAEQLQLEDDGLSFGEWVMSLPLMPGSSTTVGEHHRAQHPDSEEADSA